MRKYLLTILSFLAATYSWSQMTIEVSPGVFVTPQTNGYLVEFNCEEHAIVYDTLENNDIFQKLSFPSLFDIYDHMDNAGQPELPFYSLELQFPENATNLQVTPVGSINTTNHQLSLPYTPHQDLYNDEPLTTTDFDSTFYATNGSALYATRYQISNPYTYLQSTGATLTFNPAKYDPSTNTLQFTRSIKLLVTFTGDDLLEVIQTYTNCRKHEICNAYYPIFKDIECSRYPKPHDAYLILLGRNVSIQNFVDYKEGLGYHVIVRTVGVDVDAQADSIHRYIHRLYEDTDHKLKYVLLVGTFQQIPVATGVCGNDHDAPSDWMYACQNTLDISTEPDYIPELFVGRWPTSRYMDLSDIIKKSIRTEKALYSIARDDRRVVFFSGKGNGEKKFYDANKLAYDLSINELSYQRSIIFDGRTFADSTRAANQFLSDLYNEQYNWAFVYRGHGGIDQSRQSNLTYTSTGAPYYISAYNIFENRRMPETHVNSFGFGLACELNNECVNMESFGKKVMLSNTSPCTFFAATTKTKRIQNNTLEDYIFREFTNKKNIPMGVSIMNSVIKYYNAKPNLARRRHLKKNMFYGDPSLYMYGILDQDSIASYMPMYEPFEEELSNEESTIQLFGTKIVVESPEDVFGTLYLYNCIGQLIQSFDNITSTCEIDCSMLSQGTPYLAIFVNNQSKTETRKIFIL